MSGRAKFTRTALTAAISASCSHLRHTAGHFYFNLWPRRFLMIGFGPVSRPRSEASGGDAGWSKRPDRGADRPPKITGCQTHGRAEIACSAAGSRLPSDHQKWPRARSILKPWVARCPIRYVALLSAGNVGLVSLLVCVIDHLTIASLSSLSSLQEIKYAKLLRTARSAFLGLWKDLYALMALIVRDRGSEPDPITAQCRRNGAAGSFV